MTSDRVSAKKPEAVGAESKQLAALTRPQKLFLANYSCAWCDQPANYPGCGAIYDRCAEESRCLRRASALRGYVPRKRAPTASGLLPERAVGLNSGESGAEGSAR